MNKRQRKKTLELEIDGDLINVAKDPYLFILKEVVRALKLCKIGIDGSYEIKITFFPKKSLQTNQIKI